jgi:nitrite reductase/ring-hydroxylating ferredoxin subunit
VKRYILGRPVHGSRFCIRDGRVLTGSATVNAPRYDVRIRNGQIEVKHISE